jgi:hypothetical protein
MFVDSSARIPAAQLEHAILYASEFGRRVVPCYTALDEGCSCKSGADCSDPGKHPRLAKYLLNATDCPNIIGKWWAKPEFGAVWRARDVVLTSPLPPAALKYRKPAKQHLVALCHAIQAEAGAGIWYLSWRSAHDALVSMGHKVSLAGVGNWLRELVREGVLVQPWEHEPGSLWAQRYLTAEVAAQREMDPKVNLGSFLKSGPATQRRIA